MSITRKAARRTMTGCCRRRKPNAITMSWVSSRRGKAPRPKHWMSRCSECTGLWLGVPMVTGCWRASTCANSQTRMLGPAMASVSGSCVRNRTLCMGLLYQCVETEGPYECLVVLDETGRREAWFERHAEQGQDVVIGSLSHRLHRAPLGLQLGHAATHLFQGEQAADRDGWGADRRAGPADPARRGSPKTSQARLDPAADRAQGRLRRSSESALPETGFHLGHVFALYQLRRHCQAGPIGRRPEHKRAAVGVDQQRGFLGSEQQGSGPDGLQVPVVVVLEDGEQRIALVEHG